MITRKVAPGNCRGLHDRRQAGRADAAVRARARRTRATRGRPERRVQYSHRGFGELDRDRQGTLRKRYRPASVVHRLDAGRPHSDAAVRAYRQENRARTRRPCAVHRVRRCGSGCGSRRRGPVEVSQCGANLRLHEPLLCARSDLRQVRRKARCRDAQHQGRQRLRSGREPGPADRRRTPPPRSRSTSATRRRKARSSWRAAKSSAAASWNRPCSPM